MKQITVAKDTIGMSVKGIDFYDSLLEMEHKSKLLAEKYSKFSADKAIHIAVANAYSMAALMFINEYGKLIKDGSES